jgi:hypothetical protein
MKNYKLSEISSFVRDIGTECTILKLHRNYLIAGSHNGELKCWDINSGLEKWSNHYEGPCSEMIIQQGLIYLAEEGNVHCIDLEYGKSKWNKKIEGLSEFIKSFDGFIWVGSSVYDLQISNYSESSIWKFDKEGELIKNITLKSKPWFFDVTNLGLFIGLSRPVCGYGKINKMGIVEYFDLVNKNPVTTGICHKEKIFLGHSDGNVTSVSNKNEEYKNSENSPVKEITFHKGIIIGLESGKVYSENGWEIDLKKELDVLSCAPSNDGIDYLWASTWENKSKILSIDNNMGRIEFCIEHSSRVRKIICFNDLLALGDSEGKIFFIENDVLQRRLKSNPEEIKIDEKKALLRERLRQLRG